MSEERLELVFDSNVPGTPDLLVGHAGQWAVLEVKQPKDGRLSAAQREWHRNAAAPVHVVTSCEEALAAVRVIR